MVQRLKSFTGVWERAADRKGGDVALRDLLDDPMETVELENVPDARFLSVMSKCVFQAGFSWKVVDQKWPGFEEVFSGFDPDILTTLSDREWEGFVRDSRIIRNPQKIKAVRGNLWFLMDVAMEHGSFGQFLADWPPAKLVDLFKRLKRDGSRLGGATGPRVLRYVGMDTFILAPDVVTCLRRQGIEISGMPTSKRDLSAVQAAFNQWRAETGMPFQHLSMVMAYSEGENYTQR
jgi:3-methyladenine DNA glycosylase Tag